MAKIMLLHTLWSASASLTATRRAVHMSALVARDAPGGLARSLDDLGLAPFLLTLAEYSIAEFSDLPEADADADAALRSLGFSPDDARRVLAARRAPPRAAAGSRGARGDEHAALAPCLRKYEFSEGWFHEHAPNWEAWLVARFAGRPAVRALEIGCFEGLATCWLLERVLTHASATVAVVDTFRGSAGLGVRETTAVDGARTRDVFERNVRASGAADKVEVFAMTSARFYGEQLGRRAKEPFDVVYVDGSHLAPDVLLDAACCWRMLRRDGVMIFDDYLWGESEPPHHRPAPAIDAFLECHGPEIEVLHKGKQVAIRRLVGETA